MLFGPRKPVVGEGRVWTNEHIVLNPHTVPQINATLDCYVIADYDVVLNETVAIDVTVTSDNGPGKNYTELPDPCAGANVTALAVGERMNKSGCLRRAHDLPVTADFRNSS